MANALLDIGIFRNLGAGLCCNLQIRHLAPPVGLRLQETLECRRSLRDPFRVVQAIDADDQCAASQASHHALSVGQSRGTLGKTREGRAFDANREHADPNRPIGDDEIEVVAVKAAFPREITAEIEGVVAGLEADKIVFAERWNETVVATR